MVAVRRLAVLSALGGLFVLAFGHRGGDLSPAKHDSPQSVGPKIGRTSQRLIAQAQTYVGTGLGDKELVFTFDDGPSAVLTGDLSAYLKSRPAPIQATFFVNGACITTTA